MNPIVLAVIIVSVIGLVLGLVLAVASIVMAVPVDEKAEEIEGVLPGANCGACGFSGCAGYASALSKGETTDCARCAPGGAEVATQISEIMGLAVGSLKPMAAVVKCHGNTENCDTKMNYHGDLSCKTAAQLFGGPKACNYGCLGFGDCVKACPYDAIGIFGGVAVVNPLACKACKLCIGACPKNIIELVPLHEAKASVFCMNHDKGAVARKSCKVACIGCMKCQKVCEADAVHVVNNLASVDYDKCTGCGKCAEACPTKCLELILLGGASGEPEAKPEKAKKPEKAAKTEKAENAEAAKAEKAKAAEAKKPKKAEATEAVKAEKAEAAKAEKPAEKAAAEKTEKAEKPFEDKKAD